MHTNKFLTLLMAIGLGLSVVGCEREGPLERAGEEVDEAVDDAGDAIEDAGDRAK